MKFNFITPLCSYLDKAKIFFHCCFECLKFTKKKINVTILVCAFYINFNFINKTTCNSAILKGY